MSLNISKGNMYEFVTHTWNTVKGKCHHDCSYCYMKRWGNLKDVRFDKKELKTDLGEGNFIFVGSSCDMWADDIDAGYIFETLFHCAMHNNKYLFQTKNTIRFTEFALEMKPDSILCTTIETNRTYPEIMRNSPSVESRAFYLQMMKSFDRFVTIEPIMDFDLDEMVDLIKEANPKQVNIGADSGNNNLPEPSKKKVLELKEALSEFTVVKNKRNLDRLI